MVDASALCGDCTVSVQTDDQDQTEAFSYISHNFAKVNKKKLLRYVDQAPLFTF